jgi:hypothetical protein
MLCLLVCAGLAGHGQNLAELEKRNGFKDIQLGMSPDSVKGSKLKKEFKELDEYPAKLYTVNDPAYGKIGEVDVKEIEIKAYKDLVYNISVRTDKDPRLMKALESIYGKSEYDIKNQIYFWKTDKITLRFKPSGKHHLELEYNSPIIRNKMKADKAQKVDEIANDF